MSLSHKPSTKIGHIVNEIEESIIAILLGLMTLITFVNVILRYGFNTGIIWGLESVTFLFAWLVLFGVSYGFKVRAHLGVDALINVVSDKKRKSMAMITAFVCILYAFLLLKGSWDYWANFANLPQTTGRWFPTGFEEMKRTSYRAWYEVIDVPFPEFLRWIEPLMNEGERYEKLPRFVPYAILPFGMALLLYRIIQNSIAIYGNEADSMIISHEAEEAVAEAQKLNEGSN